MEELGKQIAERIIQESAQIIGLYPGSFSPAHRGHVEVVKRASQHVDELHIIISNNIREGYTPEVSLKVWKQYLPLLPENVKVKIAVSNSPITEIYSIVKDKTNNYIVVYGKGEKDRYNSINENREKYSNVDVIDAGNFDNLSATSLREAIRTRNRLAIKSLIPEGIKVDDFLMNFQIHEIKVNKPGILPKEDFMELIHSIKNQSEFRDVLIKYGYDMGSDTISRFYNRIKDTSSLPKLVSIANGMEKRVKRPINEAKQIGDVYHFTSLNGLKNILDSNSFKSSTTEVDKFNPDFRSFRKKESDYKDKGITDVNYFSTTRDQNLWKKDPKIGGSIARIKIDGNKLSNKYKINPFYYYSDEMPDGVHPKFEAGDESEERINLGTQNGIPVASNYIKEIDVFLDKLGDNTRVLKLIQELQEKYPQIKTLYKDKEMSVDQYISDVLPTIEPYHNVDEIKVNNPNIPIVGKEYLVDEFGTDDWVKGKYMGRFQEELQSGPWDYAHFLSPNYESHTIDWDKIQGRFKPISISEIKVNKPGLNFPIKISTPEEAQRIGQELLKQGYTWDDGKIDIYNAPFKTNHFEPFILNKIILNKPEDKTISLGFGGGDEELFESKLLKENIEVNPKLYIQLLDKLTTECCKELGIEKPKVYIINNPKYTDEHHSYGGYLPASNEIKLVIHGRDCMSSVRSLSHELKHAADASQGLLTPDAGKDGDEFENSANSYSGKTCRWFGRKYPEAFFLRYD